MLIPLPRRRLPFAQQIRLLFFSVVVFTAIEVFNGVSGRSLNAFGVIPRHPDRLLNILFSPFIHGNFTHFISNLSTLIIFQWLLLWHGILRFWLVSVAVIVLGGLGVYLFGRPAIHIGASGLIFGYFGYLLLAGLLSRELPLLLISLLVGALYGSLLWGVLPIQPYVSFESHLFGLLAGLVMALLVGGAKRS